MKRQLGLIILMAALITGCTTIRGRSQRVKVASEPEGADILYKGEVIGQTPAFVNLPRQKDGSLSIQHKGYDPVNRDLTTSYRWGDSFFSNFIWFFWGAPAGWGVDLLTGTAWDYDKIDPITLGGGKPKLTQPYQRPLVIAIAPPQSDYELLSDEMGKRLALDAQARYHLSEIKGFDSTIDTFSSYNYIFDERTKPDSLDDLYYDLGTTHILESEVKKTTDGIEVTAHLRDIFSEREIQTFKEKIPKDQVANYDAGTFKQLAVYGLGLVPNTATIDVAQPTSNLEISNGPASVPLKGTAEPSKTFVGFLSAFGLRNLKSPKLTTGLKGVFRFVPVLSFSFDRVQFTSDSGTNPLNGYVFDWYTAFAGVGPELGLESPIGYFYLDFVPGYAINWISGSGNDRDASNREGHFTMSLEAGYQLFVSNRVNLRLFARAVGVPDTAWDPVLNDLTGQSLSVQAATRGVAGISIGYYVPEDRAFLKKHLF